MEKRIGLLIMLLCFFIVNTTKGQLSVTGYSQGVISISTSTDRLLGSELKFFSNKTFGNGLSAFEFDEFINFHKHKYYQLSFGLGINLSGINEYLLNTLVAPITFKVFPFVDNRNSTILKHLSLIFEVGPEFYPNYDYFGEGWNIRNLVGLRFNLSD
jgi:hypothetical protein